MSNVINKVGRYRWNICALIFFATTINYLDRQVIGILKGTLETELGIGEVQYGNIIMAFTALYAVGMVVAGKVIDWLGTKKGYAMVLIGWSLAAMAHALAKAPFGFGIARGLLGVSEAGNFPAAIKTTAEWFPKKERALATGYFNSGANVGAILAPIVVPLIAINWGWQWAFILTGAVGFIWLIFWFLKYETPEKHSKLSKEELEYINSDSEEETVEQIPWGTLLKHRQTWAFFVGKFLTDPIWWFYLYWIPSWLQKVKGVPMEDMTSFGLPIAVIYTATTVGSIFGGWLSSLLIKRGLSAGKARSVAMLVFAFMVTPIMFVQTSGVSFWGAIAFISIAASSHQAWSANIFTTVSDMFPKKAVASVTGIGGFAGAIGGMLIAGVAGHILGFFEKKGHIDSGYLILFIISGTAYLVAWLAMRLIAPNFKRAELK